MHHFPHRHLVGVVAHGEVARDRERGDLRRMRFDGRAHGIEIERCLLVAGGAVAAGDEDHRIGSERLAQAGAFEDAGRLAHQQQTDRAAVALDQGVGCQRRRKRHQHHRLGRRFTQHRVHRAAHADGEILACRQRLGRAQHALAIIEQHRVGVGSAGVYSEQDGHRRIPVRSRRGANSAGQAARHAIGASADTGEVAVIGSTWPSGQAPVAAMGGARVARLSRSPSPAAVGLFPAASASHPGRDRSTMPCDRRR